MATQLFRDTQFCHLVRLLSGNKLFRYPDENDPSLWEKSVFWKDTTSGQTEPGQQSSGVGRSEELETWDQIDLRQPSLNHTIEEGKDVYLIDWYGPDDPEVSKTCLWCSSDHSLCQPNSPDAAHRIHTTGPEARSY